MSEYSYHQSYTFEPMGGDDNSSPKKKGMSGKKVLALVLAAAIVGGASGAAVGHALTPKTQAVPASSQISFAAKESASAKKLTDISNGQKALTPAEVYAKNVGAVCGIRTEITTNIFGQVSSTACAGSGFVITADGYVVTNYHVIDGANSIKVSLENGETYDAKLIGGYEANDIALLKVDGENMRYVTIGNSDDLVIGEMVAAIGNPLGELTYSMTVGYVSALDREINIDGTPINMLQTDAAINSGNSGGALFDMSGNVVGITSAKYSGRSNSGAYIEGLCFCIPINDVIDMIQNIRDFGYVKGVAFLGVTIKDLNKTTAEYYSLPVGPYVASVEAGSCAEKAGIQSGDIITVFDGKKVETYTELSAALKKHRAGDTVTVDIYRGGQQLSLTVTLDEAKQLTEAEKQQQQQQQQPPQQMPDQGSGFGYNYGDFFDRFFNFGF